MQRDPMLPPYRAPIIREAPSLAPFPPRLPPVILDAHGRDPMLPPRPSFMRRVRALEARFMAAPWRYLAGAALLSAILAPLGWYAMQALR